MTTSKCLNGMIVSMMNPFAAAGVQSVYQLFQQLLTIALVSSNCTDTPGHDDYFVSGDDQYYPPSNEGGGGKGGGKGGKRSGKGGKSSKYCNKAKKGHKGGKGSNRGHRYYECEDNDTLPGYDDYWIPTDGKWKQKPYLALNTAVTFHGMALSSSAISALFLQICNWMTPTILFPVLLPPFGVKLSHHKQLFLQ